MRLWTKYTPWPKHQCPLTGQPMLTRQSVLSLSHLLMRPHIAYTHNKPCATLIRHFCDDLGQFALKDDKWRQKATLCDHLRCLIPFYNTLQCSLSLLWLFLTFSDAFRPFATFLDFALFNTLPNCVAFSSMFHQTLFTWLVHHSFGFSGIISLRSALCFTDISRFILLLQLYLCFLLPPLPKRTESSPFDRTTVYWPQIPLRLSSLSFSLAFLVYRTDRCRLFWNFVALSLWTYRLLERHFLTIFGSLIIISTHSLFPLSTARDRLPSPRTLVLYCGVCSVVVLTI